MKTRSLSLNLLQLVFCAFLLFACQGKYDRLQFAGTYATVSEKSTATSTKPSKEETLFKDFINNFEKKKVPLEVTAEILREYQMNEKKFKKDLIDEKYASILPSLMNHKFSRRPMEANHYYYARIKETPHYTAVLYITVSEFAAYGKKSTKFANFKLVTFSPKGELIDEAYDLAHIGGPVAYAGVTIDATYTIHKKAYDYVYNKKINGNYDYENGVITGTHLKYTKQISITDNGEIDGNPTGIKPTKNVPKLKKSSI
ncbi:MAG: hypothetical protein ACFB0B_05705 [Thermonemataceae bacterium]